MALNLTEQHLRRLGAINFFPISEDGTIFFGLRGCLPVDEDYHDFEAECRVVIEDVNYLNPRCTIGQWHPREARIAVFPGSTVPHIRYVKISKEKNGIGANQLMTGFYRDYRKGIHAADKDTRHEAFRQTESHPIRRTADDFDFDNDDRVEFDNPYDNLHAAWCMGVNHDYYASAGCQVVVGFPRCPARDEQPDMGPWAAFKEKAYSLKQDAFPYLLVDGRDLQRVILNGVKPVPVTLRFGSKGPLVSEVQTALKKLGYYEGKIDEDFGNRTLRAVLAFQTNAFGPQADDGVVGPITALALGIAWPKL